MPDSMHIIRGADHICYRCGANVALLQTPQVCPNPKQLMRIAVSTPSGGTNKFQQLVQQSQQMRQIVIQQTGIDQAYLEPGKAQTASEVSLRGARYNDTIASILRTMDAELAVMVEKIWYHHQNRYPWAQVIIKSHTTVWGRHPKRRPQTWDEIFKQIGRLAVLAFWE